MPKVAPPLRRIEYLGKDLGWVKPTESGTYYGLASRVRFLWMIGRFISWFILYSMAMIVLGIATVSGAAWTEFVVFGLVFMLIPATLHMAWPMISYRYWGVALRADDIVVRWGVLWKRVIAVPFARIQHVDSRSGPIERSFGLANLMVHTAGSHLGAITVPGLPIEQAEAFRDYLSKVGHSYANI